MTDQNLIAVRLSTKEQVRDLYHQLHTIDEADDGVRILDAVGASKNEKGHLEIEQTQDVTGTEGVLGGGFVGMIVGVMLGGPVGLAVGALTGAAITGLYARLRDSGVQDQDIRELARELQPGQALLFILYEGDVPADALAVMRTYHAELVHARLPEDVRQQISDALSATGPVASPGEAGVVAVPLTVAVPPDPDRPTDADIVNAATGPAGEKY